MGFVTQNQEYTKTILKEKEIREVAQRNYSNYNFSWSPPGFLTRFDPSY